MNKMNGKSLFKLGTMLTATYMLASNLFAGGYGELSKEDEAKLQEYVNGKSEKSESVVVTTTHTDTIYGEDSTFIDIHDKVFIPGKIKKISIENNKIENIVNEEDTTKTFEEDTTKTIELDPVAIAKRDSTDEYNVNIVKGWIGKGIQYGAFKLTEGGINDKTGNITLVYNGNFFLNDSSKTKNYSPEMLKNLTEIYNAFMYLTETNLIQNTDGFKDSETKFPLYTIANSKDLLTKLNITLNENNQYNITIDGKPVDLSIYLNEMKTTIDGLKEDNGKLVTTNDSLKTVYDKIVDSAKGMTVTGGYQFGENSNGNKLGVEIPLGKSPFSLTLGKASNIYSETENNGEIDRQDIVSQTTGNVVGYTSNNQITTLTKAIEAYMMGMKVKLNPESKVVFELEGGVGYRDGQLTESEKNRLDTYLNNNRVSSNTTVNTSEETLKPSTYYFGGAVDAKNAGVKFGANVYPIDKMVEVYMGFTPRQWVKEHRK